MQDMGKSLSRVTMDRIDVSNKDCVYVCPFLCSYCFQAFVQQQSIFIKVLGLPNT